MTRTGERILHFISEYQAENGKPPTHRAIMRGVGLKSPSSVQYWINIYIESGQLVRIGEEGDACNVRVPNRKGD